ncbi:hypothetical protein [Rhizobium halophilum]|uniref:hypothetical protein n=1 Tax=Rhizobium halophilum TaxID=2846852 RepID=UPI001EFE462B|nr:hypothetical protein [Rhizobium halophilum]MCF6370872.1 hypothetical protein [Rhizobium halophilum]
MSDAELTPRKRSLVEKRAATDAAALAIIDKEAADREKKTERLRALRLAQPVAVPKRN